MSSKCTKDGKNIYLCIKVVLTRGFESLRVLIEKQKRMKLLNNKYKHNMLMFIKTTLRQRMFWKHILRQTKSNQPD